VLAPRRKPNALRSARRQEELARARQYFDHLAGLRGAAVTDALPAGAAVRLGRLAPR
jgi:hypothetical protein